jgi:hypothetical protein
MTSEQRSCTTKIRHASQRAACKALGKTRYAHHLPQGELQIYACRFCHSWHIGSKPLNPQPIRRIVRK